MESELNFSQQQRIFNRTVARPVTVIGAGSVGSFVVTMLPKMGVSKITVYDRDAVESHNVPMSAYRLKDQGRYKVEALAEIVREQSGLEINAIRAMYTGEPLRGTVIACVDSMEARMLIWKQVKINLAVDLLVDTRVAGEFVRNLAVNPNDPDDVADYEKLLYPGSKALRPTCGNHGIVYVATVAAAAACAVVAGWWTEGAKQFNFAYSAHKPRVITP
ncbi:MAG: ThiF family adenylyltransferase [Patescibacteria group bacterium]